MTQREALASGRLDSLTAFATFEVFAVKFYDSLNRRRICKTARAAPPLPRPNKRWDFLADMD
jgi:hypothetical protein